MRLFKQNIRGIAVSIFILLTVLPSAKAQTCSSCDISYEENTSSDIFISTGTVCVASNVVCSGNVYLQGGVLCNHGTVQNLILNGGSGIIHNFHIIKSYEENINIPDNVIINNYPGALFESVESTSGEVNFMQNGNSIEINNYNQATFSFYNNLNVVDGSWLVNVGISSELESAELDPTSYFNLQTASFNSAGLEVSTSVDGVLNISGALNLNELGDKSITNYGVINLYNGLNIGGTGSSETSVFINNLSQFNVNSDLNITLAEGTVTITNADNTSQDVSFTIGGNLLNSMSSCTITNNSFFSIEGNIQKSAGKFLNNQTMDVGGSIANSGGQFTNALVLAANSLTNSGSGTINNSANAFLNISTTFSNASVVNLGIQSSIKMASYYNNTGGFIVGATLDATQEAANAQGKILVTGYSQNTSTLSGYILIYDHSLVPSSNNTGYGFDNVGNTSTIGNKVVFAAYSTGSAVEYNCSKMPGMMYLYASTPTQTYCPFGMYPYMNMQLYLGSPPNISSPLASSYTVMPGSHVTSNSYLNVNPIVTTIYTISTLNNGCMYTQTVIIEVCEIPIPTISYSVTPFSPSTGATFSVTQTGIPNGSYYISPSCSGIQINSSTGLITASGSQCFQTYTVTYCTPNIDCCESGCFTTSIVLENLDCPITYTGEPISLCPEDKIVISLTGGIGTLYWAPAPVTPTAGLSCTACPSPTLTSDGIYRTYTVTAYREGRLCGTLEIPVAVKEFCQKDEIIGCCFSNYGAAVTLADDQTYITVHCNLLNELGYTAGIQKGEFENNNGTVGVLLDWIHNGKNTLYTIHEGTTSLFGGDQKLKGNSVTEYNELWLQGNGIKTIYINEDAYGNLDLTTNQLSIRDHVFSMKDPFMTIIRTNGYASDKMNGYFSWNLGNAAEVLNQNYVYPMGGPSSVSSPFRYRPIVMANNSTTQRSEISVNFMNTAPSPSIDMVFVHTNTTLTNNVNNQAPNVLQINRTFYHKIKPSIVTNTLADIVVKTYYLSVDGQYQSISEWEKDPVQTLDWWGSTPGASASIIPSSDPGYPGMLMAMANGTFDFNHKAFSLARGGFYINTNNFGNGSGGNGPTITVTATPTGGGSTPTGGGLNNPFGTGTNSGNNGGGGNTVFTPSPVSGEYVMNITPGNNCEVAGKVRFVIEQSGNIQPSSVKYGLSGSSTYLGELSRDVFTIDNLNSGITFSANPRDILKNCVNTVTITTTTNADHVLGSGETFSIVLPAVANASNTISYGQFKIYNNSNSLVWSSGSNYTAGTHTPNPGLGAGVYRFELTVTASTAPPLSEIIQGQIIVK